MSESGRTSETILRVENLVVKFGLRGQVLTALRGVSLDLQEGQTLAIVGESGAGKSVFTKCFLGMLDSNGWIDSGSIWFEGQDLSRFRTETQWLKIRGKKNRYGFPRPNDIAEPS